jgi:hypothetical protein
MAAIRAFDVLLLILSLCALRSLLARHFGKIAGLWGMVFWGFWYQASGFIGTAQADGWAGMLTVLSGFLIATTHRRRLHYPLLAGLLMGWVILYKPVFIVLSPVAFLFILISNRSTDALDLLWTGLIYLAGMATAVGSVMAWLWWKGSLYEMIEIQMDLIPSVYARAASDTFWERIKFRVFPKMSEWAPLILLSFLSLVWLSESKKRMPALLGAWLLAGIACVAAQNKYFGYHFHPLVAPLAAGAAIMIGGFRKMYSEGGRRRAMLMHILIGRLSVPGLTRHVTRYGKETRAVFRL